MKLTKADLIGLSIVLAVCWMAASFIFVCFGLSVQYSILLGLGFWFGLFLVLVIGAILWSFLMDTRRKISGE